ncbi:MAG: sugar nucleotide-binding protein [Verrucomicrobia bacterium]|nr:sugar nucleotide-binding protein [Verrucomicrobiota bacterium]
MTIFLAGASGLVGSAVARAAARRGHRVTGAVGSFPGPIDGLHTQLTLDLADEGRTTGAVLDVFPDAIVNCAAVSSPDQVDANPVPAQALNMDLPARLGRLAHHLSARLVHLSSEQVFAGAQTSAYTTHDTPAPLNPYGRQKLLGEQALQAAAPQFAITLRVPLLMGNSLSGRRSCHERLLIDWAAGRTPGLFIDEYRQPCTAGNLAEVIVELCERRDLCGVYHWAGTELISRYELGRRIREHFRLSEEQAPLREARLADQPELARKRPACLALDIGPLASRLKTRPQAIADQLPELAVPPACREWYHRG